MSIQESVAQLRALNFEAPLAALQQANYEVDSLVGLVMAIMGEGASGCGDIIGALQVAKSEIDGAINAVHSAEGTTDSVAGRH